MSVIRSHDEDMERIRVEHENAMEAARETTRRETEKYRLSNRKDWLPAILIFLVSAGVVFVLFILVIAVRGDSKENNQNERIIQQVETQREKSCFEAGGGWMPKELVVGEQGICVFPGQEK